MVRVGREPRGVGHYVLGHGGRQRVASRRVAVLCLRRFGQWLGRRQDTGTIAFAQADRILGEHTPKLIA